MSRALILDVPFPLSTNAIWRMVIRGKRVFTVKSDRYLAWLKIAEPMVASAMEREGRDMIEGPVMLTLSIRQPDKRQRDIDNMSKCVLDVMEGHVFADDSQVHDLRLHWDRSEGAARCVVTVHEIGRAA